MAVPGHEKKRDTFAGEADNISTNLNQLHPANQASLNNTAEAICTRYLYNAPLSTLLYVLPAQSQKAGLPSEIASFSICVNHVSADSASVILPFHDTSPTIRRRTDGDRTQK